MIEFESIEYRIERVIYQIINEIKPLLRYIHYIGAERNFSTVLINNYILRFIAIHNFYNVTAVYSL